MIFCHFVELEVVLCNFQFSDESEGSQMFDPDCFLIALFYSCEVICSCVHWFILLIFIFAKQFLGLYSNTVS